MSERNLRKGREIRRKLLGDEYVDKMSATTYKDPLMQKFIDVASETIFATLWTRPGLDLKMRTLITVISDVSTGREPELAIHLRMARRQDWTEEELSEAILHLLGYVGAPLVRDAMLVATKVFADLRAEDSKVRPRGRRSSFGGPSHRP
jgi:4-carboxymuconolactone decarboxylase